MLMERDEIVEMIDELLTAEKGGEECASSLLEAIISILWAWGQRHG